MRKEAVVEMRMVMVVFGRVREEVREEERVREVVKEVVKEGV